MKKTPLEKRIKRRITARRHIFFAVTPPGLKRLCHRELIQLGMDDAVMIPGGVEFKGFVHDCYTASLFLGSPSRIKMRIAAFKAENFRTLEKKLKNIEWELYLKSNTHVNCEVTTRHSRLYHKKAIALKTEAAIVHHFLNTDNTARSETKSRDPKPCSATIFIRAENDQFDISLDASGDLLYKRGIKKEVGSAPIRENLAFALLNAAGFTKDDILFDPMCGSGTFILEGSMIKNNIPPGFYRTFAFEDWPCFSIGKWDYIKNQAEKKIKNTTETTLFASDVDKKNVDQLKAVLAELNMADTVNVFTKDFFSIKASDLSLKKGVVVLNPPYGKRMGNPKDVYSLFVKIGTHLKNNFSGWRTGIVLPDKSLARALPFSVSLTPGFHGGLDIFTATGTIP
ncbi:MAG: RNA methyltransferase [Desulfobacteraceae bacterium]